MPHVQAGANWPIIVHGMQAQYALGHLTTKKFRENDSGHFARKPGAAGESAQKLEFGWVRNSFSSGVDARPRISLRCG